MLLLHFVISQHPFKFGVLVIALLADVSLLNRKSLSKFFFKRLYVQHKEEITNDNLSRRKFQLWNKRKSQMHCKRYDQKFISSEPQKHRV